MTTTTDTYRAGRAARARWTSRHTATTAAGRRRPARSRPPSGEFSRPAYPFQGRITADGSSGYPAEAGRYHLYISWACPWAQRTAIVRKLLGLEDVISLSVVDPIRDGRGWAFREGPDHGLDPVNGFAFLREAYEATEPGYDGHISVPVLWDKQAGRIVSNNFPDITIDLDTQFGRWADPDVQLYPAELRTGDRRDQPGGLHLGQQRRVPVRLRDDAAGLPRGGHGHLPRARPARGASGWPQVPDRGRR